MSPKERRNAVELQEIVMHEVRKYRECSYVRSAAVTPRIQAASHHASWGANFVCDGAQLKPAEADFVVTRLQNQYDLV
jgi:hypothetical protein